MSNDKNRYEPLRFIQRLHMRNKDNQIPFFERFSPEYMGSTEFELGHMGRRIREMDQTSRPGEVMVHGIFMLAIWNPERFNKKDVERELNRLYRGEQYTKERTNFNQEYRRESRRLEKEAKEFPLRTYMDRTNAWFDIINGLFWTWERCNIADLQKNFRLQVAKYDGAYVPKPQPPKPVNPLRQRMIDEGHLRPARSP